jgi:hypothetical protein
MPLDDDESAIPDNKSVLERNLEHMRQLSDGEVRMALVKCKTLRELTAGRIRDLQKKLATPGYRRGVSDQQDLQNAIEMLIQHDQLIAAYKARLKQGKLASGQSQEQARPAKAVNETRTPAGESRKTRLGLEKHKLTPNFTSKIKLAIKAALIEHPELAGKHLTILQLVDEGPTTLVPLSWKAGTRLLAEVYRKGGCNKRRLQQYISRVKKPLKDCGII